MRTARSRGTAGKDNAARVPISPASVRMTTSCSTSTAASGSATRRSPGAIDAVAALREAGKSVLFLTNDVRHPPEGFVRKLWRLGFQASLDEVAERRRRACSSSSPSATAAARRYVVGSQALVDHVAEAGLRIVNDTEFATRADVVVVGGHDDLVFEELELATQAVLRGAELIGATRDANFPMPDGLWPGTGAVLAAIETATGRTRRAGHRQARGGDVRRRPRPPRRRPHPRVGDRLEIDVAGARRAGLDSALVLTGGTTPRRGRGRRPAPDRTSPTRSPRSSCLSGAV